MNLINLINYVSGLNTFPKIFILLITAFIVYLLIQIIGFIMFLPYTYKRLMYELKKK